MWSPYARVLSSFTFFFANVSSSLLLKFCCYVFLLCSGCVSLFLSSFVFIVLFTFHSVVYISCILSLCDKKSRIQSQNAQYLKYCFDVLLRCCILTLSLGPDNNPHLAQIIPLLGPENNPSKWYLFWPIFVLNNVLTYLFLQCFFNINQTCPKNGPPKSPTFSQCAKQNLVF